MRRRGIGVGIGIGIAAIGLLVLGALLLRPADEVPPDSPERPRVAEQERVDAPEATLHGAGTEVPPGAEEATAVDDATTAEPVVHGRVIDAETGSSVAGAWVHCLSIRPLPGRKTISGADGRYRLRAQGDADVVIIVLGGGWYSAGFADAMKEGLGPYVVDPATVGDGGHDLLVEPAARVRGHVYDADGRPEVGARVALQAGLYSWSPAVTTTPHGLRGNLTVTTDAAGAFLFAALVPGRSNTVWAEGSGRAAARSERIRAERGGDHVVDLHLPRVRFLHVHVVEVETGTGMPDVEVSTGVYDLEGRKILKGMTDEDGRVTLGPVGTYVHGAGIRVEGGGWLVVDEPDFRSLDPEADAHVTYRLDRGLPLRGRVLEPGDVPAAGIWLVARKPRDHGTEAETDAEGNFEFPCLRSGIYELGVRPSYGREPIVSIEVNAGDEGVLIRLTEKLPRDMVIHVLGPDGEPVPQYDFAYIGYGGQARGDYTVHEPLTVPPGEDAGPLWIEIQAARDENGTPLPYAPVGVGPLAPGPGPYEIRLEEGTQITGRVVDEAGKGIKGATVKPWPLDRGPAQGRLAGWHGQALTDAEGRFELVGLAAVRYRISVEAGPTYAPPPRPIVESGRTDVVIRVGKGTSTEIRLVDVEGKPVEEAFVFVLAPGGRGSVAHGRTDSKGRALLKGLEAGAVYSIKINVPQAREDLVDSVVERWTTGDAKLTARSAGFVRGRVVDEDGAPVHGGFVRAMLETQRLPYGMTGEDGSFEVGHLPPGRVRLVARRPPPDVTSSQPVEVEVGATDVEIVIPTATELTVLFRDWPKGAPKKRVVLRDAALPGLVFGAEVDGAFQAVFRGPFAGRTYTLFETLRVGQRTYAAYTGDIAGDAETVEVAFAPAASIQGVVTGPPDAYLATVRIDERGVKARAVAHDDGRFVLTGIPEGTWTLEVTALGDGKRYTGRLQAHTGEAVTIALE